jgi:antitoxin component of RelBE/YafQ-DinJ toxin-antitoxin module
MSAQTAITFRIPTPLKKKATLAAKKVGVPLSLVLKNALKDFIVKPKVTLTENGFTPEFEEEIIKIGEDARKNPHKLKELKLEDLN